MPITIYINEPSQVERLINWGIRSADAESHNLLLIVPRRQKGSVKWDPLLKEEADQHETFKAVFDVIAKLDPDRFVLKEDVTESLASSAMDRIIIETRELVAPNPAEAFVDLANTLDSVRLILPAGSLKSEGDDEPWAQRLYQQAPCETTLVWGSPPSIGESVDVMVVADAETGCSLAARRGVQLSRSAENGSATLLYVWPDDDDVAPEIAKKNSDSVLAKSGSRSEIETKFHFGNSIAEAIDAQDLSGVDVVVFGTAKIKKIRSIVRALRSVEDPPAIAVTRPAVSVSRKMLRELQSTIRQVVPQLDREERISLVEKLETGSKFNFDFCALISLSTLIAALGLADNSAAVVIGAMLVAPLMTPLVGIGFALIQGNLDLIRNARWAVLIGFANAFVIGMVVGLFVRLFFVQETFPEMASRDAPYLLDLFVALASGIAGAYALSRKGLNGAIPGVAIAAALIPPIATLGNWELCLGALLLFLTNIVFIVLGTAMVFWAIGIDTRLQKRGDSGKRKQYVWIRYWFLAFVIASVALTAFMAIHNQAPFDAAKQGDGMNEGPPVVENISDESTL
jgi:uncharacterized hydrophobic protein (TIGR00271 family)